LTTKIAIFIAKNGILFTFFDQKVKMTKSEKAQIQWQA